ncbi:MAG: type II secretion system inner membrane protein GspF [Polyangiaceae bacterium]|nr:type II secretion system inner membrane protein GspF [Polyangiaceae bacterium]MBK8994237.1 type II secretion system inner membrane protein GspF [Myxococcales bacterium]MCL4753567.1 type II secretion system inner membrane protein GspF [Myxococcales bacterium]
MAVFEYRGIQIESGKAVKGYRDADNAKALRALLRKDGILLTLANEEGEKQKKSKREIDLFAIFRRVSSADVAVMTRQLATLVRAGVPLVDSISALTEQVEKEQLVRVLSAVRETLNEGTSFAKSLEMHPRVFPPLYVNMVAAGEASGTLENVLERLADFMEGQARLKGKVVSALAYPVLMMLIGSLLVGFLMVAVVPKVTSIFENLGQTLPWNTQLLIFVSNTLGDYWWLLIALALIAGFSFQRWKNRPAGRMRWDVLQLRWPVFGRLNLLVAVARFTRTLSTLLSSGVPLLKAMEIGRNVLGNVRLESVVTDAIGSIREGESIAEPLKRSGAFPPMVIHMIAVGERSGQLEAMLENVSRAYESDVETRVTALTSLLEPVMILALGAVVGFIAMSILMPLMQMNQLVQ